MERDLALLKPAGAFDSPRSHHPISRKRSKPGCSGVWTAALWRPCYPHRVWRRRDVALTILRAMLAAPLVAAAPLAPPLTPLLTVRPPMQRCPELELAIKLLNMSTEELVELVRKEMAETSSIG